MFKPGSLTEFVKLISSSPSKSCELDPISTFLLKSCSHTLIVKITKIINVSLSYRVFASDFKHIHVNPILKKTSLPVNDPKS